MTNDLLSKMYNTPVKEAVVTDYNELTGAEPARLCVTGDPWNPLEPCDDHETGGDDDTGAVMPAMRPLTLADRTPREGDTAKPIDKRPTQSKYRIQEVKMSPHEMLIEFQYTPIGRGLSGYCQFRNWKRWKYIERADGGPVEIAVDETPADPEAGYSEP